MPHKNIEIFDRYPGKTKENQDVEEQGNQDESAQAGAKNHGQAAERQQESEDGCEHGQYNSGLMVYGNALRLAVTGGFDGLRIRRTLTNWQASVA
jgi:hypothetical protein